MSIDPVEARAGLLAELTAKRAVELATANAEKATKLAVDRAVKDANIDRDIREHSKHLEAINGSQRDMANSLRELSMTFATQVKIQEALAKAVQNQQAQGFSRRTLIYAFLGVIAAYGTIIALLVVHFK